jgi:predicted dehydrogenase
MKRRDFIHQSAAALTAASVVLPDDASGAIAKVRTGMLGTRHSHFGGKLTALLNNPDFEVVSIVESDAEARAKLQKDPRLSAIKWIREEELLADPSIHLIVVECSAWEAIPWGKKVIAAGKHLHLEKPPGNEWGPFKQLVEDARRKNLIIQTGYLWRWHQGVMAAVEAAKKGWLGEVFMVRGSMNADRDQAQRDTEAKYKGGGLFELGGHVLDRMVEVLGRPKSVQSWLKHHTSTPDRLADNSVAVLEFDHALGVLTQSAKMSGSGDHRSFEVLGTDGSVIVHPEANPPRLRVHMRKAVGPYKAGWQDISIPPQPRFIPDLQELGAAIKAGKPLKHSYDHELLLHETLLRASGEIKG